jgi:TM2 domain-containing membrane protein YozV
MGFDGASEQCFPPTKQYFPANQAGFNQEQAPHGTNRQYVKYVPVGFADTHSKAVGYLLWIVGFTGAHRFYYGKPLTGILWFFTFGLLGIGWLVDLFLIPTMDREADYRFCPGTIDYNLSWVLLAFVGWFGVHRFYQGKIFTGILYFLTGGLFGVGYVYDILTLNQQVNDANVAQQNGWAY